jgi:hypothetical protein
VPAENLIRPEFCDIDDARRLPTRWEQRCNSVALVNGICSRRTGSQARQFARQKSVCHQGSAVWPFVQRVACRLDASPLRQPGEISDLRSPNGVDFPARERINDGTTEASEASSQLRVRNQGTKCPRARDEAGYERNKLPIREMAMSSKRRAMIQRCSLRRKTGLEMFRSPNIGGTRSTVFPRISVLKSAFVRCLVPNRTKRPFCKIRSKAGANGGRDRD